MGKIDLKNWWKNITSRYETFEVHQGEWKVDQLYEGIYSHTFTRFCMFTLLYNSVKDNYKLKVSGFKPKNHGMYPLIVEKINNLNRK